MTDVSEIAGPVLVVVAHCGGTVARLAVAGVAFTYVLFTSGHRGTSDPGATIEELAARREEEQRAASDVLGVDDIRFLRHDVGDLGFVVAALREEIVRLIREVRPRTVITHDPFPGDGSLDSCAIYPDHTAVGRVTFESAFVCAPGPLFYPQHLQEGLGLHKPDVLYLMMSANADRFVDFSDVWETKLEALHRHRSQGRNTPENDAEMERIAGENGRRGGYRLAEAFRVLRPS